MSEPTAGDARQIARARELFERVTASLNGASNGEALDALIMAIVALCTNAENPDRALLQAFDGALTVFRDMTNSKYRNEDPTVS